MSDPSILIVGLGNALRTDDGAGILAVRGLAEAGLPERVRVAEHRGDGLALLDLWAGFDRVILCDAVAADLEPGTVISIDLTDQDPPDAPTPSSTHGLGLKESVAMARALGQLPARCLLVGVVLAELALGAHPSPPVLAAIQHATETIRAAVTRLSKE
ncbi:Hydrogenase maturation protease [Sulfidibacter corallicola]|uniref:Hydrogenase maturation protease n=1 Tax=Sulfidibacter corallicola TaxID=2818388 RepID=A0A8A4TUK9_SULCO|nr:hydrogenase maturation protease [Sulfidibacter corallicola]QTD53639.1 hydrogenase maturation protease [Sulfidibacter corallicola]